MPGALFAGSFDGHLRAYATEDGATLWDFDTAGPYDTIDAVKAVGGALDIGGATLAGGMLYVNTGYRRAGAQCGQCPSRLQPGWAIAAFEDRPPKATPFASLPRAVRSASATATIAATMASASP